MGNRSKRSYWAVRKVLSSGAKMRVLVMRRKARR